ncbi:possible phosphotransferase [Plesiocystis pacifica SIR-1]|uniref:Probable RNA 2'-phosphotransferase n=1 Tax=Plesiocystis pacifica SIR-1 TaxID=391625 RepID=A6G611_9BACT|nr:RNA 2'-phosphotransferase [Plesiocystis pacifica]EDM78613.1 possible phosphotransferase [Plesiocystis pacifica SIR-1]
MSQLGKRLAWLLRHEPEAWGLRVDAHGWMEVEALLAAFAERGHALSRAELETHVAADGKQRFILSSDGARIRAVQGHSIAVDLELDERPPPAQLFHGTPRRFVDSILREGLIPKARHHVHLSADEATARQVGARRGPPVILLVDAATMAADGHRFFVSANGVWLCERVPPEHLRVAN